MGLSLDISPLRSPVDLTRTRILCGDRLRFDEDHSVFLQINGFDGKTKPTIKVEKLPAALWVETYEEGGIHKSRTDRSGAEITFAYAYELKKLDVSKSTPKNKAIVAFIGSLPDDTPVLLFW
jgi:hypothetical protein